MRSQGRNGCSTNICKNELNESLLTWVTSPEPYFPHELKDFLLNSRIFIRLIEKDFYLAFFLETMLELIFYSWFVKVSNMMVFCNVSAVVFFFFFK